MRWTAIRRAARGTGLAAVTAVTLLGAAGPAGGSNANAILKKAVESTLAAHSARVAYVLALSAPGQGSRAVMALQGVEQFSTPVEAAFTVSVPTVAGEPPRRLKELLDGTTFYVEVLGTWYSVPLQQALANVGLTGSASGTSNPADALALLYQEGDEVERVGRSAVDGTATTQYRATVDLDRRSVGAPHGIEETPAGLKALEKLSGRTSVAVDVWIDGSGVIRQERIAVPLSRDGLAEMGVKGAPRGIEETTTVDWSDFGSAVHVTPPASARPLPATTGGLPT